jgi:hypothetical protein
MQLNIMVQAISCLRHYLFLRVYEWVHRFRYCKRKTGNRLLTILLASVTNLLFIFNVV